MKNITRRNIKAKLSSNTKKSKKNEMQESLIKEIMISLQSLGKGEKISEIKITERKGYIN